MPKKEKKQPDVDIDDLMTPEKVAELLMVTTQRLAEWRMGRGNVELPYIKLGKFIRYERRTVIEYLNEQRQTFTIQNKH